MPGVVVPCDDPLRLDDVVTFGLMFSGREASVTIEKKPALRPVP
jgi:hypothetical protein